MVSKTNEAGAGLISENAAMIQLGRLPDTAVWYRLHANKGLFLGTSIMTQFNEADLTAAVVKSFENTPDPRAKFLLQELVKSLHDYVRKTDLTFEEWDYAIDFLTRVGQKCTPIRQEFILLSDVFGVSMLVDVLSGLIRDSCILTLQDFLLFFYSWLPSLFGIDPD